MLVAGCVIENAPWFHSLQVTVLWGMLPKNIYLKVLWAREANTSIQTQQRKVKLDSNGTHMPVTPAAGRNLTQEKAM